MQVPFYTQDCSGGDMDSKTCIIHCTSNASGTRKDSLISHGVLCTRKCMS